jgi:hypothetical protein
MKKLFITFTLLTLLLTACGAQATQAVPTQGELNTESKLILGTLKLDGTAQAVTAEQAQELVIYWQVYQEISQSDTAAQEEISGLLTQIEGTMTTEQMQAIDTLGLTQRDVMTVMQEKGLMANIPARDNASSSGGSSNSGGGFTPPDGGGMQMGAGGPPDMGAGGPMGGGTFPSDSFSTNSNTQTTRVNPTSLLIDALIEYLQGIAGG